MPVRLAPFSKRSVQRWLSPQLSSCERERARNIEAHQAKLEEENPFEEELSQDEPKPGDPEYEMLRGETVTVAS